MTMCPSVCMCKWNPGLWCSLNECAQEGRCNQCTCRNGFVRCTEFRECRGEDNDAGTGDDDDADSRMCDDCMDMPNGPVCAVRDGRTFPTRCHAMRCKGFEMTELRDGPCSEVVSYNTLYCLSCPHPQSSCILIFTLLHSLFPEVE